MNKLTAQSIINCRLVGKAKYVFAMLKLLATTEPIEQDKNWWIVRAYIIAKDNDRQPLPLIKFRRN